MSFNIEPTKNLAQASGVIENTDRWNLSRTDRGYRLTSKASMKSLEFTGKDATRLETALADTWKKEPGIALDRRLTIIWNRFFERLSRIHS